jgi:hypothetical protein
MEKISLLHRLFKPLLFLKTVELARGNTPLMGGEVVIEEAKFIKKDFITVGNCQPPIYILGSIQIIWIEYGIKIYLLCTIQCLIKTLFTTIIIYKKLLNIFTFNYFCPPKFLGSWATCIYILRK